MWYIYIYIDLNLVEKEKAKRLNRKNKLRIVNQKNYLAKDYPKYVSVY